MDAGGQVTIAWIHGGDWRDTFGDSLVDLLTYDLIHENRIRSHKAWKIKLYTRPIHIAEHRNTICGEFLERSPADWLFWVDTDMGFAPGTLDQLIASADPEARPVMAALCFGSVKTGDSSFGGMRVAAVPTIYDSIESDEVSSFTHRLDYQRDAVVQCDATGAACMVIHRGVLEAVKETWGPNWFTPIKHPKADTPFGEDISFCLRVRERGFPIHVDTSVRTTHDKGLMFLDEELFIRQQQGAGGPVPRDADAPSRPSRAERRRLARAK